MRIDNSHFVPPADAEPLRKTPARAAQSTPPSEDRVELSGPSTTAGYDPSRSARIEELTAQVQQGTYRISDEDLARGIVNDMLGTKSN